MLILYANCQESCSQMKLFGTKNNIGISLGHFTLVTRVVHGLGRIRFWVDLHPTQLAWVNIKWTRNRLNVRVKPGGSSHRLSRSKPLGNFEFEAKEEN